MTTLPQERDRDRFHRRLRGGGSCPGRHSLTDIVHSWLGSFVGILAVTVPAHLLHLGSSATIGLIGSFGASAVLVYALPQADLAQPRNVIGGHVISAAIGVTSYQLLHRHPSVDAAAAVASAIAAMHLTRTLHPPGGATALIAVTGGPSIHQLGYGYVLAPTGTGAAILVLVALVVNNTTSRPHRHYPHYWW
ncbi:MAG TPA: HPP family protein [Nocardioides sp.]|nr:HPP family protein [Nocardioides sp.]